MHPQYLSHLRELWVTGITFWDQLVQEFGDFTGWHLFELEERTKRLED